MPPAPVQLSVNVLLVVRAPVDTLLPEVALVPDHAPLAVQPVALVEDQVSALALPLVTLAGLALIVTVGAGVVAAVTVTVVDWAAVPPAPVQLSVKVLLVVRAPVDTLLPEVALVPDHAPLAVQLVALADDHVSALEPPLVTLAGLALIVTVGAGVVAAVTVTVVDWAAVPPAPVQLSVKVLLVVRAPVDTLLPEVALVPDHAPLAVQPVALVDDHVSVLALPEVTVVGFALIATVGELITVTVADWVAVPPAPVQLNVNVLLAVKAPVDTLLPAVALVPDHAPLAVQLVALVDDQVSLLAAPLETLEGLALSVTVGADAPLFTVTITDCVAVPPGPVQASVNVLLLVRAPVETLLPEVACVPDQAPLAVQLVAFVDDHVRALAAPVATVVGLALIETVGAETTVTVADCSAVPPGPVQLSVYVPLCTSAPVDAVPVRACVPDHASLAVQLVVLADDHVRVLAPPAMTVVGFALIDTVGAAVTLAIADCAAVPPVPVQVKV